MDLEREMELMRDRQARAEAEIEQIRHVTAATAHLVQELGKTLDDRINRIAAIVQDIAEIQRLAEEENREAHRRYEEAHRQAEQARKDTEERLNILVKMMDEWIRERGKNRGTAS